MTNPITTPAEALEAAARITDEEAKVWKDSADGWVASFWRKHAAAIRALSARIATQVAPTDDQDGLAYQRQNIPLAQPAAPVAVVKPLEWEDQPSQFLDCLTHDKFGLYQITDELVLFAGHSTTGDQHPTIEAAKAAAQADYESRILSRITIQPAAQVKAEAVAGAYAAVEDAASRTRHRLEIIADQAWHGDARDFKRLIPGVFDELDNLTPADTQAALARRDAEVREKALREAAAAWLAYERATTTEEHHNAVSRIRNAFGIEVTEND